MHIKQLKEKQKQIQKQVSNFYTPSGLHVYFKDTVTNGVNVEKVISKAEEMLPQHLRNLSFQDVVGKTPFQRSHKLFQFVEPALGS